MRYVNLEEIGLSTLDPQAWLVGEEDYEVWSPVTQLPTKDPKTDSTLYLKIYGQHRRPDFEAIFVECTREELAEKIKLECAGYYARILKLGGVETNEKGLIVGYEEEWHDYEDCEEG